MPLHLNQNIISFDQRGFALIAAIIACVVLFVLAMLVIHISTADLRVSAHALGEKKASIAAEAGVHYLMKNFNFKDRNANVVPPTAVDQGSDPDSVFSIQVPTIPTVGPEFLPISGMSMENGGMAQKRYDVIVVGEHRKYGTKVEIQVGVGYGPVPSGPVPE